MKLYFPAMVRIELMDWERARAEASAIRRAVFVVEQGVPEDIELDEHDPYCLHALARDAAGRAIGTGLAHSTILRCVGGKHHHRWPGSS